MKGLSNKYDTPEREIKAILAGNDILLMPDEVAGTIDEIRCEVREGHIAESAINKTCKRILAAKYHLGLYNLQPIDTTNLVADLNDAPSALLKRQILAQAITVAYDPGRCIPLSLHDSMHVAYVNIGTGEILATSKIIADPFETSMKQFIDFKSFKINKSLWVDSMMWYLDSLKTYDWIIVAVTNMNMVASRNYGLTTPEIILIDSLCQTKNVIVDFFGSPYAASRFTNIYKARAIIMSYDDSNPSKDISAQIIFGGISSQGRLPVSVNSHLPIYSGIPVAKKYMGYCPPSLVNMDEKKLNIIDSIATDAIASGAMPGCQILVAKDGMIVYEKAFGYHTYLDSVPVKNSDLYDIASLTKIVATTPGIMWLYDEGLINLNRHASHYLDRLKKTNKKDITLTDLLTHQGGLQPFIPFHLNTMDVPGNGKKGKLYSNTKDDTYSIRLEEHLFLNKNYRTKEGIFSDTMSSNFPVKVADKLFIAKDYHNQIWKEIDESKVSEEKKYVYSDLDFMYLQQIIEEMAVQQLDSFVYSKFYKPLGLKNLTYLPLNSIPKERIVPTEDDKIFRKQLLQGYVHDPTAALLGGVCGHAGLFSNAHDLAILMQVYLQDGEYAGNRYFKPGTVEHFITRPYPIEQNRRAMGFDKPAIEKGVNSNVCAEVSDRSFGHTGFTGTMIWVDPEYKLTYIFLSNRINPDALNTKLAHMNIRTKIQQAIYQSIK